MSEKGYAVLLSLIKAVGSKNIAHVVISKDENVMKDFYEEIRSVCEKNNIPCSDRSENKMPATKFCFTISWRWLIKAGENDIIIFHDSLLPKYRGFAPLVNMLVNGEKYIGVTALFAEEQYDTGKIIAQIKTPVKYPVKIKDAIEKITPLYSNLAIQIAKKIIANKKLNSKKQNERNASYSLWRDEEDYKINWHQNSEQVERFINAVGFPYKGASASDSFQLFRITDAEVIKEIKVENRTPGKIIFIDNGKPVVVCGKGLIRINAMTDSSGNNALPFKKIRTRFV